MKFIILTALMLSPTETKDPPPVLVEVAAVLDIGDGSYTVVLKSEKPSERYMPIFIGGREAYNIQLRMLRQQPPRPLTLNLLESIIKSVDIKVEKVVIDNVIGGIFTSTLFLRQNKHVWKIDARPSDAIGLAAGANAPIWVAKKVFDKESVSTKDIKEKEIEKPHEESL